MTDLDIELLEQQDEEEKDSSSNENGSSSNNNNNKKIEFAFKKAEEISKPLFKDQYGVCYGWLDISGHKEVIKIESSKFKRLLIKLYYDNVGYVPSQNTIDSWTHVFHALADFEGPTYQLSLRVTRHNDDIYYDMTNQSWQCIKVTKEDWELLDRTPIPLFVRHNQIEQVQPSRDYEPDIFDRFLDLTNLKKEEDRILLTVYIISLLIPDIPHVVLQLHGEKGSAKSTLQTLIKLLVDPAKPKLLTIYNDVKEFIQQLAHNYTAYYDNLKYTPKWLSDEACKAVTGVGSTKRKLYSDDDDIVYEYRRCLGFNGINLGITEPDILDRSIMIELQRIRRENTKQDVDIMTTFLELRPKLLGYIFDTLAKAIKVKPTIKLDNLPRMADFAIWGEAIARAMGYKELEFISVYFDNIGKQNIEAIENSLLGQAVSKFVTSWYTEEAPSSWQGPMSKALEELNKTALENNIDVGSKSWPKAVNSLSRKLKPILSNLREGLGINITIVRNTAGDRKVRGTYFLRVSQISSPCSPSSPEQNQARNQVQNGEDISNGEDPCLHPEIISSPKSTENHAQNLKGEDSEDSEDIFSTEGSNGKAKAARLRQYEELSKKSLKASKTANVKTENDGLTPQGKEWET